MHIIDLSKQLICLYICFKCFLTLQCNQNITWMSSENNRLLSGDVCQIDTYQISLRYFWWNLRAFWSCIDRNRTTMFKVQKGSKDIVKIVHVASVDQLQFYETMRILLVQIKTKIIILFNNFFSSGSVFVHKGVFFFLCAQKVFS